MPAYADTTAIAIYAAIDALRHIDAATFTLMLLCHDISPPAAITIRAIITLMPRHAAYGTLVDGSVTPSHCRYDTPPRYDR